MKKFFPILAIIILLNLNANQTLAYFSTQASTVNTISTADLELNLYSMSLNENGDEVPLNTKIQNIIPGDTYSQIPYVKNLGTTDCYTRINLKSSIKDKSGKDLPNLLKFNIDETKWILDDEGYYRYFEILKSGETIPVPFFTEIHFPVEMDNKYIGSVTEICLQAQAVQSDYNEKANVLDVQGFGEIVEIKEGV